MLPRNNGTSSSPPPPPWSAWSASVAGGGGVGGGGGSYDDVDDDDDDEVGRLSDSVRRALECPVCLELPCSISTCCENGHGLCDECSYRLMQLHRGAPLLCPVCRSAAARGDPAHGRGEDGRATTAQPPPPTTVRKLFEIMSVTRVACAYRPQGCPELAYVSLVSVHEAMCPYASQVRCMVSMCRWMGAYHDAFRHVAVEHQFSAYDVLDDRFEMPNLKFGLRGATRRMYLARNIRDNGRLYWIGVARPTEAYTQVAVLEVVDPAVTAVRSLRACPGKRFRVRTANRRGWPQARGRPRTVAWDRTMLARVVTAIECGVDWNTCESALHLPQRNVTHVFNEHQNDVIITWGAAA